MKSIRFNVRRPKGVVFNSPSLTQQQFKHDTDVNVMIRRALAGDINAIVKGTIVDASDAPESLHEAFDIIARAESSWEELPFALRHSYGSKEKFLAAFDEEYCRINNCKETVNKSPDQGEPSKGESVATNT